MYKLSDVIDDNGNFIRDKIHLIGKEFEPEIEVGKQAVLNNISDAHIYRRVERTSIVDRVVETVRELQLITRDATYFLRKL